MIFPLEKITLQTIFFVLTTAHLHAMEFWQPPSPAGPLQQAQRAAACHLWGKQEATTEERTIIIQSALDTMVVAMVHAAQAKDGLYSKDVHNSPDRYESESTEKRQHIEQLISLIKNPIEQARVQEEENQRFLKEIKAIAESAKLLMKKSPMADHYTCMRYLTTKRQLILGYYNCIKDQRIKARLKETDDQFRANVIKNAGFMKESEGNLPPESYKDILCELCQIIDDDKFYDAYNTFYDSLNVN